MKRSKFIENQVVRILEVRQMLGATSYHRALTFLFETTSSKFSRGREMKGGSDVSLIGNFYVCSIKQRAET